MINKDTYLLKLLVELVKQQHEEILNNKDIHLQFCM